MKLKPLTLALTLGILAAFYMLFITYYPVLTENLSFMRQKGFTMRFMMYDLYPVYSGATWWRQLFGVVFGFADGFIFGILFGYLYNFLLDKVKK
jgi:hypothetical protein